MKNLKKIMATIALLFTIVAANAKQTNNVALSTGPPYEISTVAATKATENTSLQYIISPNGAFELALRTEGLDSQGLMYLVQNAEGLVVKSNRIEKEETILNLSDLPSSTYYLIVSNEKVSKTFKIVKKADMKSAFVMGK